MHCRAEATIAGVRHKHEVVMGERDLQWFVLSQRQESMIFLQTKLKQHSGVRRNMFPFSRSCQNSEKSTARPIDDPVPRCVHNLEPEHAFNEGQHHRWVDRARPAIGNGRLDPQGVVNADGKIRLD